MSNVKYQISNKKIWIGHWSLDISHWKLARGFTLTELLLVIGLVAIILSFSIVNILPLRDRASINTLTSTVIADIRQQQLQAMIGDTEGNGVRTPHSIYFTGNTYTSYPGTTYSAQNQYNFTITLDESVEFVNTFLNNTLTFASGSGAFANYTGSNNTLILRVKQTGQQRVITLNQYGVVISAQ